MLWYTLRCYHPETDTVTMRDFRAADDAAALAVADTELGQWPDGTVVALCDYDGTTVADYVVGDES